MITQKVISVIISFITNLFYKNFDFIALRVGKGFKMPRISDEENFNMIKRNWKFIINLNICKANYICSEENMLPKSKDIITQKNIFLSQIDKYLKSSYEIAILNSFPLFIYC